MVQRYKFESKSQQVEQYVEWFVSCFQWFKDTNLKVNHNVIFMFLKCLIVVSNGSKIQI